MKLFLYISTLLFLAFLANADLGFYDNCGVDGFPGPTGKICMGKTIDVKDDEVGDDIYSCITNRVRSFMFLNR